MPFPRKRRVDPDWEGARQDTIAFTRQRRDLFIAQARVRADKGDDPHSILTELVEKINGLQPYMSATDWRITNLTNIAAQTMVDKGDDLKKVVAFYCGSPERDRREAEIRGIYQAAKAKAASDKVNRGKIYNAAMAELEKGDQLLFVDVWRKDLDASKK